MEGVSCGTPESIERNARTPQPQDPPRHVRRATVRSTGHEPGVDQHGILITDSTFFSSLAVRTPTYLSTNAPFIVAINGFIQVSFNSPHCPCVSAPCGDYLAHPHPNHRTVRPGRAQGRRRKKSPSCLVLPDWLAYHKKSRYPRETDMKEKTFSAIIHKEADLYVAECPELGTVSQENSIEHALANLREATELYLEEFPLSEAPAPLLTTFEAAVNV